MICVCVDTMILWKQTKMANLCKIQQHITTVDSMSWPPQWHEMTLAKEWMRLLTSDPHDGLCSLTCTSQQLATVAKHSPQHQDWGETCIRVKTMLGHLCWLLMSSEILHRYFRRTHTLSVCLRKTRRLENKETRKRYKKKHKRNEKSDQAMKEISRTWPLPKKQK